MRSTGSQRAPEIRQSAASVPLSHPQRIEMHRQDGGKLKMIEARTFDRPRGCTPPTSVLRSLNAQRNAHGLIDTLRVRMSIEPGTEAYLALSQAVNSLAQSAITGKFGDARQHLRAAMTSSTDQIRSRLKEIDGRCSSNNAPINPEGHSSERIGTQALAGVVCARLLSNTVGTGLRAPDQPASLLDSAAASAAHGLVRQLIECQSKDQIHERLARFVDNFTMGTCPLPKGRLSIVDEVRSAIAECETFDVDSAGVGLATASCGPMLVAAYNSFDPAGFGLAA